MNEVIDSFRAALPTAIMDATWDDTRLWLGGAGWNFNSMSAWRVIEDCRVVLACTDPDASDRIKDLIGLEVVDVLLQSLQIGVDPVFVFSDGRKMEIFSSDTFEPWTLRLPSGEIFVASPSDPQFAIRAELLVGTGAGPRKLT